MKKIEIKNRFTGETLFQCEVPGEIKSGLRKRHALEKAVQIGADLSDADLRYVDLRGADLSGADLSGADLRGADLRCVDLRDADLRDADLRGADLRGADLRCVDLRDADLRDADLSGADLSGADLSGADLRDADLRCVDLRDADLRDADLSGVDLNGPDGNQLPRATPEQAIENLDKVRAIIMDNQARLEMGYWHSDDGWKGRTCAEEAVCETTHCIAGWLQVCSTEPALKNIDAQLAGTLAAPVAAKMFFRGNKEAYEWLESRAYVAETEEAERRAAERAAKRAGGQQ